MGEGSDRDKSRRRTEELLRDGAEPLGGRQGVSFAGGDANGRGGAAVERSDLADRATLRSTRLETIDVPAHLLSANDWNPNELTEDEFAELVAEVKHLGRLPKPVVVRPNGTGYTIVDGEHGWRAAQSAGLPEVACEVLEADDFEAMRQTYKRNQHGTHHPVKLGRMFRRMLSERDLSVRALAVEVDVSEGTIRNHLLYAQAADVRNGYAFEKLGVRQVREYLNLPQVIGDAWLDDGADLRRLDEALRGVTVTTLSRAKVELDVVSRPKDVHGDLGDGIAFAEALVERGFFTSELVRFHRFVGACHIAVQLLATLADYSHKVPQADGYLRAFAEFGARVPTFWLLHLFEDLPCVPDEDGTPTPCFTVDEWRDLLADCQRRTKSVRDFLRMVDAAIELALKRKGLGGRESPDITNPHVALMLENLKAAPDFICQSGLSLREQIGLHELESDELDPDVLLEVKRQALDVRKERERLYQEALEQRDFIAGLSVGSRDVVHIAAELVSAEQMRQEEEVYAALFADRKRLTETLLHSVAEKGGFGTEEINRRPCSDVLRERLDQLPWSEMQLIASLQCGWKGSNPFRLWAGTVASG